MNILHEKHPLEINYPDWCHHDSQFRSLCSSVSYVFCSMCTSTLRKEASSAVAIKEINSSPQWGDPARYPSTFQTGKKKRLNFIASNRLYWVDYWFIPATTPTPKFGVVGKLTCKGNFSHWMTLKRSPAVNTRNPASTTRILENIQLL